MAREVGPASGPGRHMGMCSRAAVKSPKGPGDNPPPPAQASPELHAQQGASWHQTRGFVPQASEPSL